jgi:hypothetical protein
MTGRRRRREAERLRHVVDCLPYETRVAMREGLDRYDRIIVGAYSDRSGGVCPMLAAHRCGGRTDFRSFARAWDRFTGAGRRARCATGREVRTLAAQIEASIWSEEEMRHQMVHTGSQPPEKGQATGSASRPRRHAGSWLVPFRRWDGYREAVESALKQLRPNGRPDEQDEQESKEELVGS